MADTLDAPAVPDLVHRDFVRDDLVNDDGAFMVHLPFPPRDCVEAMSGAAGNPASAYLDRMDVFRSWHETCRTYCALSGVRRLDGPVHVLILLPRTMRPDLQGGLVGCVLAFLERESLAEMRSLADLCVRYSEEDLLAVALWQVDHDEVWPQAGRPDADGAGLAAASEDVEGRDAERPRDPVRFGGWADDIPDIVAG